MIPKREREALMRLTMCARGECPMCEYEEQCDNWDFRMELATKNMNILAEALRKTENSSEIPNIGIGCSRCGVRFGCIDRDMPHAVHCNNYGKITDEPQERSSK